LPFSPRQRPLADPEANKLPVDLKEGIMLVPNKMEQHQNQNKLLRIIDLLPKTKVGSEVIKSIQMILLKGNNVSREENIIFNCFIERLATTLMYPKKMLSEAALESNIDRAHGFLI
jgi:hypothetical protein